MSEVNFLVIMYFVGICIASFQDLARREVDNWLNYLLLASGFAFLVFSSSSDYRILVFGIFAFLVVYLVANLFYYGRIFAGGDAKLLIALSLLFISVSFTFTLINIGLFILFLMISGSVYGLGYTIVLFFAKFKENRKELSNHFKSPTIIYLIIFGIFFMILGYFNFIFFVLGLMTILGLVLYALAKTIEKVSMIKLVSTRDLREGDWIMDDIRIKGKVINSDWEGVTKKDLVLLRKLNRKVKVKDGIPFVPAFLIAFILYVFRSDIIAFVLNMTH